MFVKSGNIKKGKTTKTQEMLQQKQTKKSEQKSENVGKTSCTGGWVPCVVAYIFLASASSIRTRPSSMRPLATFNGIKTSFKFSCVQFINFLS